MKWNHVRKIINKNSTQKKKKKQRIRPKFKTTHKYRIAKHNFCHYFKRDGMFITFSQQILCGKLFLAIINGQKSNLSCRFKLKICNKLPTRICCENIVDLALLLF